MTDLMERIRAYVAELPTHECIRCVVGSMQTQDGKCKICGGALIRVVGLNRADALLQEVAALEPVAYRYVDYRPWMQKPAIGYTQNPDEFGVPDMLESLYTLTGASSHE